LFELKVLPIGSLTIQHIVLVIDARVKRREKRRYHSWDTRIKWWHLKDENTKCFPTKKFKGRLHQAA